MRSREDDFVERIGLHIVVRREIETIWVSVEVVRRTNGFF